MNANPFRRFRRFTLRTLLLLTAVVACWLGVQVNKAQKQRAAVAVVYEAGGAVLKQRLKLPLWLGTVMGSEYIYVPTMIQMNEGLTSEDVANLQQLPSLEVLIVFGGHVPESVENDLPAVEVIQFGTTSDR